MVNNLHLRLQAKHSTYVINIFRNVNLISNIYSTPCLAWGPYIHYRLPIVTWNKEKWQCAHCASTSAWRHMESCLANRPGGALSGMTQKLTCPEFLCIKNYCVMIFDIFSREVSSNPYWTTQKKNFIHKFKSINKF